MKFELPRYYVFIEGGPVAAFYYRDQAEAWAYTTYGDDNYTLKEYCQHCERFDDGTEVEL